MIISTDLYDGSEIIRRDDERPTHWATVTANSNLLPTRAVLHVNANLIFAFNDRPSWFRRFATWAILGWRWEIIE